MTPNRENANYDPPYMRTAFTHKLPCINDVMNIGRVIVFNHAALLDGKMVQNEKTAALRMKMEPDHNCDLFFRLSGYHEVIILRVYAVPTTHAETTCSFPQMVLAVRPPGLLGQPVHLASAPVEERRAVLRGEEVMVRVRDHGAVEHGEERGGVADVPLVPQLG